jgi:hypothetical protein
MCPPYWYKKSYLDTVYGKRQVGNTFMIGDQIVVVDPDNNIHIGNTTFLSTKGLWELLTRKKIKKLINADDLQQYKTILEKTNALIGYTPNANINVSRGLKYRDVISKLFPGRLPQRSASKPRRREWISY